MLTPRELERYDRQVMMGEIGPEGQAKIKQARVVIAGAGGLGSTVALYLATFAVNSLAHAFGHHADALMVNVAACVPTGSRTMLSA